MLLRGLRGLISKTGADAASNPSATASVVSPSSPATAVTGASSPAVAGDLLAGPVFNHYPRYSLMKSSMLQRGFFIDDQGIIPKTFDWLSSKRSRFFLCHSLLSAGRSAWLKGVFPACVEHFYKLKNERKPLIIPVETNIHKEFSLLFMLKTLEHKIAHELGQNAYKSDGTIKEKYADCGPVFLCLDRAEQLFPTTNDTRPYKNLYKFFYEELPPNFHFILTSNGVGARLFTHLHAMEQEDLLNMGDIEVLNINNTSSSEVMAAAWEYLSSYYWKELGIVLPSELYYSCLPSLGYLFLVCDTFAKQIRGADLLYPKTTDLNSVKTKVEETVYKTFLADIVPTLAKMDHTEKILLLDYVHNRKPPTGLPEVLQLCLPPQKSPAFSYFDYFVTQTISNSGEVFLSGKHRIQYEAEKFKENSEHADPRVIQCLFDFGEKCHAFYLNRIDNYKYQEIQSVLRELNNSLNQRGIYLTDDIEQFEWFSYPLERGMVSLRQGLTSETPEVKLAVYHTAIRHILAHETSKESNPVWQKCYELYPFKEELRKGRIK